MNLVAKKFSIKVLKVIRDINLMRLFTKLDETALILKNLKVLKIIRNYKLKIFQYFIKINS